LILGVQEPEEMRVEPFPTKKVELTAPERMMGEIFQQMSGKSDLTALLPAFNRLLTEYPEFAEGYVMRLGALCEGNHRAAIMADLDHALKFIDKSRIGKELIGSLLSMRAKMEFTNGNYVAAMDALYKIIWADLKKATEFTNTGAVKPEQTASVCIWTEPDMDALVLRFPTDYRSYLFRGLYYGKFAPLHQESLKPAMENLSKAAELNPKSVLPQLFKADLLGQHFVYYGRLNKLGWKDAERNKLDYELVAEYGKALSVDPNLLPALHGRALAYFHLKQFEKAITDYDRILSLDPKDATIYHDRGLSKMQVDRDYEAISDFNAAIKLKSRELQQHHSYEARADAYMKTRQWDFAIRDLTTAISLQVGGHVFSLMSITQFRAIYPEYKSVPDEVVAHKLHQTFFPDLRYEDYSQSFLSEENKLPSFILSELYLKRSDAYLKKGNWHRASIEFRRASAIPSWVADRWREIGPTTDGQNYIDMQTFDDTRKDSIKLWVKKASGSSESSGPYSLVRFELNCPAGRLRTLSFANYDGSGQLTGSRNGGVWQAIAPETFGEIVSSGACRAK